MTSAALRSLVVALILMAGLVGGLRPAGAATNQYSVVDLGTVLGGAVGQASAINAAGQAAGWTSTATDRSHAVLFSDGLATDLGTLPDRPFSEALGINGAGQVVGYSDNFGTDSRAFLWQAGVLSDLGTLGGCCSRATGINDLGQVVGEATTADGVTHAFLLQGGTLHDLGALPGGMHSSAAGINTAGQVVGASGTTDGSQHAVLYSDGLVIDLGTLGGPSSVATAINDAGQVVGSADIDTYRREAFRYQDGRMTRLGTLGGSWSRALAINSAGQVVGTSALSTGQQHAFLDDGGVLIDLNSLLPTGSGWELWEARGINDSGQIAGWGSHNGAARAFLLTPRPATADLALTQSAAPDPVAAGATLDYTIMVANTGPDAASFVTITDTLPAATSFVACSATDGGVCGGAGNARSVTFAELAAGATAKVTLTATVSSTASDGIILSNTAEVATTGAADPDLSNNAATALTTVSNRADLALSMVTDKARVKTGQTLTYTMTIRNTGPNLARDIVLSDDLPAGTSFVSASPGDACSTPPAGATSGTLTCAFGSLPSGGELSTTLTVKVTARSGDEIRNSARLSASTADPDLTNNATTFVTKVGGGKR